MGLRIADNLIYPKQSNKGGRLVCRRSSNSKIAFPMTQIASQKWKRVMLDGISHLWNYLYGTMKPRIRGLDEAHVELQTPQLVEERKLSKKLTHKALQIALTDEFLVNFLISHIVHTISSLFINISFSKVQMYVQYTTRTK